VTYDLFLACDPGKKGAWALLNQAGELLRVEPLPYLGDRIDVESLDAQWYDALTMQPGEQSVGFNLEYPMAVQGQSGGEKTFINAGILIALATLRGAAIHLPKPFQWKAKMGLSKDKSASVRLAVDLWPAWREKFVGPRGGLLDGMAEAALIAEHLRRANLRIRTPEAVGVSWQDTEGRMVSSGTGRFRDGEWVE